MPHIYISERINTYFNTQKNVPSIFNLKPFLPFFFSMAFVFFRKYES